MVFFPSALEISYSFLASMVSDDKSTVNFIGGRFYVKSFFSLAAFKIIFVFGFWQCDYVFWCGSFSVYHTWSSLSLFYV